MRWLALSALLAAVPVAAADRSSLPPALEPELVSFPGGGLTLQGFLWKPEGKGPFPAVLYNHGSEKLPGSFPTLGGFWTAHGFVFFVPHRHGHGRSPGEYIVDLQEQFRAKETDAVKLQRYVISLHERYNGDVVAALAWLKQQPLVDTRRLVIAGISYGGIQTVLAAEKELGVRAFVAFSPAAMSWRGNPLLRERLLEAVKHAKAPMFLLQAENDYDLGPSELLGRELHRRPNRAKLYPAFGDADNPRDGHGGFALRGSAVWGADVLAFLDEAMKRPSAAAAPLPLAPVRDPR
jgi:dienelactone hydrolase